ncbi:unnamed protein product [Paramecium octaurelia]|uniref:Uncharacterized protein n=1 Tax=Paramecium octaurelia TaxID=43137 RepID=A0A8S1WJS4_PAROT|nr:unnamed protein product [Paramecium octaurelia]
MSYGNKIIPSVPKFTEFKDYTSSQVLQMHTPHLLQKQHKQDLVLSSDYQMEVEPSKKYTLQSAHMQLTGHQSEVYCVKYSPNGDYLITAGFDKKILIWDIYNNCTNLGILGSHKNAILDVAWQYDGVRLFTASADKTVQIWDMETYLPLKKLKGHQSYVNCCYPSKRGQDLLATGGDEGYTKVWDLRTRKLAFEIQGKYPITSVCFTENGERLYTACLDNIIRCYDVRKQEIEYTLDNHTDTVTGLAISNDGSYLLSNSMDMTVRTFDIRPYVQGKNRQVRVFTGATANTAEKNLLRCAWSHDDSYVSAGSADKNVYIWDFNSKKVIHKLGGHQGTVNETAFSPKDKLIASASNDKTVIIGEIPEVTL